MGRAQPPVPTEPRGRAGLSSGSEPFSCRRSLPVRGVILGPAPSMEKPFNWERLLVRDDDPE